ncbi:MAG TPA: pyruvate dehydrogenase (acetyl-transferring), homodimeric type, partial [Actinomycetota bacterium]
DLAWAAADMRTRGFLLGALSGRTTINGEGLQHEDGHSHLIAATIPNCVSYDPTYAHEVAVIVQDGLRRMYAEQEDVFYYLTIMNENYPHPGIPEGREDKVAEGIRRGLYLLAESGLTPTRRGAVPRVQLLGSGTILREVEAAAALLEQDFGVAADVWSATSFTELARDGIDADRWTMLHPGQEPRVSWVAQQLAGRPAGPVVAATDYMRAFAEQIRPHVPHGRRYRVLGTDGFGRSDYRRKLRHFFEVDRRWVALAALESLVKEGALPASTQAEAIRKYELDPEKPNPATV